jgi:hypothetical protein
MSREHIETPRKYYTIVGGTFRVQVTKDDPTGVRRDWTSADGKSSGTKFERIVNALFGKIEDISFFDGEYGTQLTIKLDFNEQQEQPIIALNVASREAESLLKRFPAVDLTKEVRLRPFSFTKEEEEVRGIEVMQPDDNGDFKIKIANFFQNPETKELLHGYPKPEGNTEDYSKDDWKIYFLTVRKFLINYTKENVCPKLREIVPQVPKSLEEQQGSGSIDYPKDDINPDDIPF